MEYELLRKLKDGGFPQGERGLYVFPTLGSMSETERMKNVVYTPTLSELIESCEDGFGALHKVLDYWEACGGEYQPMDQDCAWKFMLKDSTPEQAVANLRLALNEK